MPQDNVAEVPAVSTSIPLAELSLEQLVGLSQHLGRQIDKLKGDRAYLAGKIAERIAAGERTCTEPVANPKPEGDGAPAAGGDAAAPGAVLEVAQGG
jgi:hypothetical protein